MAKPRWFRFSLRTLFVLVTIVACWFGWQLKWIRDRREFVATEAALPATYLEYPPWVIAKAPWPLSLFGEKGYPHVGLYVDGPDRNHLTADDRMKVDKAQRLFPEAEIGLYHHGEEGIWDPLIPVE